MLEQVIVMSYGIRTAEDAENFRALMQIMLGDQQEPKT